MDEIVSSYCTNRFTTAYKEPIIAADKIFNIVFIDLDLNQERDNKN